MVFYDAKVYDYDATEAGRYWAKKEMTKGPNKVILSPDDLVFMLKKDMSKGSKGDLVHVKELKVKAFEMKSKIYTFVRMLRDLRHENINPYVGFLPDPERPAMVTEYCSRGSLKVCTIMGSLKVRTIMGSLKVRTIMGSLKVRTIMGSLKVCTIMGSLKVRTIMGSLKVCTIMGSLKVRTIMGSLKVRTIMGSLKVRTIMGSLKVCTIMGSLKVCTIMGSLKVRTIMGSLKVCTIMGSRKVCTIMGSLKVRTIMGSLKVRTIMGSLKVRTIMGSLKVCTIMGSLKVRTIMGSLKVRTIMGSLKVRTIMGSLKDMLHNEDIKLDWDFKLSLLTDLVRGLRYMHNTPLKHHGHLTSKNCVIDSRFVLKITDYGVPGFLERLKTSRDLEVRDLLWTAPELLRDEVLLRRGTDKGDIYSISIIFQEVALRSEPYSSHNLTPEEIIKKVRKPPPLCRPSVSPQAAPPQFIQVMKQCWSEMPDMRPSIEEVYEQFKKLTGGK
nr:hypothetical protein BaRGS_009534 [Batillaria attramentaria]